MNHPINTAEYIPTCKAVPVVSVSPITLSVPERLLPLEMKVTVPVEGKGLPVVLLSHGHGQSTYLSSWRGYAPLADFYAARGFVVIQPTHLDSKALGLDPNGPEGALFWRSRAQDMRFILDHLAEIEGMVPGLTGRVDRSRIGAVGHSMGGHTVGMLAGMGVTDPVDGKPWSLADKRITACVSLGQPGKGEDLAAFAAEHYPVFRGTDFSSMKAPMLVVAGDEDQSARFSARPDWRMDAYYASPAPKVLLIVRGAKHLLGGVSGYDTLEADGDNDPDVLGLVQRITWAYLQSQLRPSDRAWPEACEALKRKAGARAEIHHKER